MAVNLSILDGPWPSIFREPHVIQLLVQEMTRRDRPALQFRAVRNDAIPDQGIEPVRLVVDQALLELAHELLALVDVDGAALLQVDLVERGILVSAPVVVADTRREKLEE